MKLVDLDIEINRICNETCGCDREHCKLKVYGKEGCNQIQKLEKANIVDAIPVRQLEYYNDTFDNVLTINSALKAWKDNRFPFFSSNHK